MILSSVSSQSSIDVKSSINSGQVFLWEKYEMSDQSNKKNDVGNDHVWYGINGDDIIRVMPTRTKNIQIKCINSKKRYDLFRMKDNYPRIINDISRDDTIKYAINKFPGLRLLRQDPFQCFISFIVSSNSSIQNIRRSLYRLCIRYGERHEINDRYNDKKEFYTFPKPRALAIAKNNELLKCGLGYRAKFVKIASQKILKSDLDLQALSSSKNNDYYLAKESLLQVMGIGDKVADCILLFSLEKLDAFPLDRWMIRILEKYYSDRFSLEGKTLTPKKYQDLHKRLVDYFGANAGYAQQFLFKMEREINQKRW